MIAHATAPPPLLLQKLFCRPNPFLRAFSFPSQPPIPASPFPVHLAISGSGPPLPPWLQFARAPSHDLTKNAAPWTVPPEEAELPGNGLDVGGGVCIAHD